MQLDKLILENFLSFEHLEYEFEKRPLLIQGDNRTEVDQKTNGVGKSGLQTAIEMCIASQNSRGVNDAELVTFGQKQSIIQLYASCDVRKETIHITTTIKVKGSNLIEASIKKYGEEDWIESSFSNVNDGKKFVLNWFAISKDDLFNYFLINKERFKSFFKASQKDNIDLINRFSDASIIDDLEKIDISELMLRHESLKIDIAQSEGKIEFIESSIEKENNRDFKTELEGKKLEIEDAIEELKEEKLEIEQSIQKKVDNQSSFSEDRIIIENNIKTSKEDRTLIEADISKMNGTIKEVNESLKTAQIDVDVFVSTDWEDKRDLKNSSIKKHDKEVESKKEFLSNRITQKRQLNEFLEGIRVKLSGAITCPKCSHEFILNGDIEELKKNEVSGNTLLKAVGEKITNGEDAITLIKDKISLIETQLKLINTEEQKENKEKQVFIDVINGINTKINEAKTKLNNFNSELSDSDKEIAGYQTELNQSFIDEVNEKNSIESDQQKIDLKNDKIETKENEILGLKRGNSKEVIADLKKEKATITISLKNSNKEFEKVSEEINMLNEWSVNFKSFKMFVANQSLEVITYHCNRYLEALKTDIRVKIEGYKQLANGTFKDNINSVFFRNEIERTFSSFSGGEKGRLLFASILANRHMINLTHPYGGLDFLSLDEILEGVDSLGLRNLIIPAKELGITCQIITHVSDEATNGDVLMVIKENDVSRVERR